MSRQQDEILGRLRRVEGQIRGIQRMITEERDCEAIVTQILAARAALEKASLLILSDQIDSCLLSPEGEQDPERVKRMVEHLLKFSRPDASD